jgi:hypothetical protein
MTKKTWTYKGKPVTSLSDMPKSIWGFVYVITTKDGKQYIGRKQVQSIRKRKFGKKEASLIKDKRKKLYEMITKESNWKLYTGSNLDLNKDIKNGVEYKKEILHYCSDKTKLTYFETKELFVQEVLEDEKYYNSNILGKFYKFKK